MIGNLRVALVLCLTALLAVARSSAFAEPSPHELVAPSLVYLKVDYTPTKGENKGVRQTDQSTGFLISDDGFILTSWRLLENVDKYTADSVKITAAVGDPEAPAVTAAIFNTLQPVHALLLKMRARALPHLTLGRANVLTQGERIFTSGFHGTDPFSSDGTVNNKFGPLGTGYLWTLNMSVAAGQSGSPVYLADGTVVGFLEGEDAAASGVGYMVPIEFADSLIAFLRFRELEQGTRSREEQGSQSPELEQFGKVIQDLKKTFEWRGQEIDGKLILDYHKLVAGPPQIKSVLTNITPFVTDRETQETYRDRSLIKDTQARDVSITSDRGGRVIIPNVGELIGLRINSTGVRVAISRVEVTIVSRLDDGSVLDPVLMTVDTKGYGN
jgi:hypothetical protein